MLKHFKLFLILTTLLYLPIESKAQSISINPTPLMTNAQVLYFSNFDFFNLGGAQHLFDITVNGLEPGNPQDPGNTEIRIELVLNGMVVSRSESDPFPTIVNTNAQPVTASNIELMFLQKLFPNSNLTINFNVDLFSPDNNFEDELYGSGKARRGVYQFKVELWRNGVKIAEAGNNQSYTFTNPSNVQLSTPGNKAGAGSPPETNDFPVFTFFSDGSEFILKVYEKLAFHNSIEDVINSGNPVFESVPFNMTVLDYASAFQFGFPQPLQIGHTYFWYVDVLVPTTAGSETFRSEVYQFKVTQGTGTNAEGTAVASIIEMLRPIVGNQVDDLSKNLSDFELKNIRLNGKPITIYELHQIIDGYEGHLVEVLDLVLD